MRYQLILPGKVRRHALEIAKANRAQKFTRVGKSFMDAVEANAKNFIHSRVMKHPSKGKTLM